MMKLLITVDYNDADYVEHFIQMSEEEFGKFKPLIDAINNFEPYICHHSMNLVAYHNWESNRQDLGEKTLYDTYPQFPKELIDEFQERFLSIHNPEEDYGATFHTIVELKNVITDEIYINGSHQVIKQRESNKIKALQKEEHEIYSYRRKSDGKALNCIPFSEMTQEENELIDRLRNLWKKYI